MSGSRGASMSRTRGENRFYVSPGMRKQQQQQEQQLQRRQQQQPNQQKSVVSKNCVAVTEAEKRVDACDECNLTSLAKCSISGRVVAGNETNSTNLDRFLEYTTPLVTAQILSKTSLRGLKNHEPESPSYFMLEDLWESFREWSAYGAGVPLLLNESETVMQYYVPFLSGIQLYTDQSRPLRRRPGEESDAESSRETSSDGSYDYGAERAVNNGVWGPHAMHNLTGSSSDEFEISSSPGRLVFQYMEHDPPFTRQPFSDQISVLVSQFPKLKTYRSCDLSPSSWVSVAWYPIYRIPTGPTLQNLDACFLTYHTLSTPCQSQDVDGMNLFGSNGREGYFADMSLKVPLPTFALVTHKFQVSFWNHNGLYECQKLKSLWRAAHAWLRHLHAHHPDYEFFLSKNTQLGQTWM